MSGRARGNPNAFEAIGLNVSGRGKRAAQSKAAAAARIKIVKGPSPFDLLNGRGAADRDASILPAVIACHWQPASSASAVAVARPILWRASSRLGGIAAIGMRSFAR